MMQYNKPYSFEKTDVRGLFYFNFFKRNVQSKHVCQLAYNGRVLGEVALCVGFERWKPFCQAPVIASALLNELLTFKYK